MPVLGHVLKHVPDRHVLEDMPAHMLELVSKHVPDRHVLGPPSAPLLPLLLSV